MAEKEYAVPEMSWRYHMSKDMEGQDEQYENGFVTSQSVIHEETEEIRRPLADRRERAIDFYEVMDKRNELRNETDEEKKSILNDEIKDIFDHAKKRERVYSVFLKPKKVSVDMQELGVQEANYVDLATKDTDLDQEPIVVIPGISNDIWGGGEFPIELALSTNRRIILITHPESWYGSVTKDFMKAVWKSNNFEPHVHFFKSAINQIVGEDTRFDICGVSAGAIITSEIIKDHEFLPRIGKKNLIVPPGITPAHEGFIKRIIMQKKSFNEQKKKNNLPKLMVTNATSLIKDKEKKKFQKGTFLTMTYKLTKKYNWWKDIETETNVIIARKDAITYGIKHVNEVISNPNLKVHIIDGGHEITGVEPEKAIEKMAF